MQEKRRAERAEQQRIRAEKEKERQARLAVSDTTTTDHTNHIWLTFQELWGEKMGRDQLMMEQMYWLLFLGGERKKRAGRTKEEAGWGRQEEEGSHQHDTPVWWNTAEGQKSGSNEAITWTEMFKRAGYPVLL